MPEVHAAAGAGALDATVQVTEESPAEDADDVTKSEGE